MSKIACSCSKCNRDIFHDEDFFCIEATHANESECVKIYSRELIYCKTCWAILSTEIRELFKEQ